MATNPPRTAPARGRPGFLALPSVRWGMAGWVIINLSVLFLAPGDLPFDRPVLPSRASVDQVVAANVAMLEVLLLMALVGWLTRRRPAPDFRSRVPDRDLARRETILLLGYGVAAQLGGVGLGALLDQPPIGFHLAGTLFGATAPPDPAQVLVWAGYNVVVYAVVPLVYFRRRYSAEALGLRSADRHGDARVIAVVLAVEAAFQLLAFGAAIVHLHGWQLVTGVPLTFALYFLGTVLPTMIFVYALLVPRYLRLTGSPTATVILGGLTYALLHVLDGWTAYGSPRDAVLSILVVLLVYVGPGMLKTVLTIRTGNAWVHVWAYHAIAPHVLHDSGLVVDAFDLR